MSLADEWLLLLGRRDRTKRVHREAAQNTLAALTSTKRAIKWSPRPSNGELQIIPADGTPTSAPQPSPDDSPYSQRHAIQICPSTVRPVLAPVQGEISVVPVESVWAVAESCGGGYRMFALQCGFALCLARGKTARPQRRLVSPLDSTPSRRESTRVSPAPMIPLAV